ncbi:nuclear envelope-associated protein 1-like isoform X2 [Camellia sinensis]|uniref:nuclear envelope-associated protein 1-like isoform X2 n=1 Tax=Camellia sinensis TaxID=4442 RepID=UPI001035AAEC|nr:nuclear envelope-associated protein 1-like isoform X2 [Camellia sinensis]
MIVFCAPRNIDLLLKDLSEKKQSFGRNVVSLTVELKEVQSRLASQEQSLALQTLTRHAEAKAKKMEEEMYRLPESLEERNGQLQASASTAGMAELLVGEPFYYGNDSMLPWQTCGFGAQ